MQLGQQTSFFITINKIRSHSPTKLIPDFPWFCPTFQVSGNPVDIYVKTTYGSKCDIYVNPLKPNF